MEPLFTSYEAQAALQRTIALHFLRTGQFETAEEFRKVSNFDVVGGNCMFNDSTQECDIDVPPETTEQFRELHSVLTALRIQDIGPALAYVTPVL